MQASSWCHVRSLRRALVVGGPFRRYLPVNGEQPQRGRHVSDNLDAVELSYARDGKLAREPFWHRHFKPPAAFSQRVFDVVFGIVMPGTSAVLSV